MKKHVTRMTIDFSHSGDYPDDWMANRARYTINEILRAYDLKFLGADFESIDDAYPEEDA